MKKSGDMNITLSENCLRCCKVVAPPCFVGWLVEAWFVAVFVIYLIYLNWTKLA